MINTIEKMEKVRAARTAKLAGKSPRERGEEKMRLALDWIYRWGWSSPSTIEIVGGASRSGLAARLVKRGLLRATRTESGGGIKGVPEILLTLTELGQQEIERVRDELLPYDRDPYRIRQDQLRHYQIAQNSTAKAIRDKLITDFSTEKQLQTRSEAAVKQPDIVWHFGDRRIGVEVELTAKWDRRLDQFIEGCITALQSDGDTQPRLHQIAVVSDSAAIIKRYRAAFTPGSTYQIWEKDSASRWVVKNSSKIPDWSKDKLVWRLI